MLKAIESGWVQRQISDSAYRDQVELERGERVVVGVNAYEEEARSVPIPKTNPKLAGERARALRTFRASRDGRAVTRILGRLEDVARRDENVVPAVIDAVQAKATLGEISDVFRTVFGVHRSRQEV
jgi:methylmalonyl-CoA mutase N-terminal domain/subunit